MQQSRQMSETFFTGALLAVAGGYLDVYTYLARGRVFANAQTGNMVLFGVNLAEGNWGKALSYFIPILAFIFGTLLAEAVKKRFRENSRIHWRQITIAVEALVLIAVAFLPKGSGDIMANAAISFVCAVQVQSFRKISGNILATTMCTNNLRVTVECFYAACSRSKGKEALQKGVIYAGIIFFFIIGVTIGTKLTVIFTEKSVLFSCIPLVLVFLLMFMRKKNDQPI